jgi:hypothetical protein
MLDGEISRHQVPDTPAGSSTRRVRRGSRATPRRTRYWTVTVVVGDTAFPQRK